MNLVRFPEIKPDLICSQSNRILTLYFELFNLDMKLRIDSANRTYITQKTKVELRFVVRLLGKVSGILGKIL